MAEASMRCVVCGAHYSTGERFCPIDGGAIVERALASAKDRFVGTTIDERYLIRRLIGKGGMGAVYEADHLGLSRRVAIKLMLASAREGEDADALARFRREARAASKVTHENIVQIFDVGTSDEGYDYIAMEFLAGADLRSVVAEGPQTTARAVAIIKQLLRGLAAIHDAGIVHRDIKPANVLLLADDVVKLTDFGIAKQLDTHDKTLTATGQVIGTPKYMSPEQLSGHAIDQRSDLYSAALVLYELLAGRAPFDSNASAQLAAMHVSSAPPSITERRSDISPDLVAVVERGLAKTPSRRFADARAMIAALDTAPVSTRPPVVSAPADVAGSSEQATIPASARGRDRSTGDDPSAPEVPIEHGRDERAMPPTTVRGPAQDGPPPSVVRPARGSRVAIVAAALLFAGGIGVLAFAIASRDSRTPPRPPSSTSSPPFLAPPPTPVATTPEDAELAAARAAEDGGDVPAAIKHYRAAYTRTREPGLLYRIGDLYERAGERGNAATYLRAYLDAAVDPDDRASVEKRIDTLASAMRTPVAKPATKTAATTSRSPGEAGRAGAAVATDCICRDRGGHNLCADNAWTKFFCRCTVGGVAKCIQWETTQCTDHLFMRFTQPGRPGDACTAFIGPRASTVGIKECTAACPSNRHRGVTGDACTGFTGQSTKKSPGTLIVRLSRERR